MKLTSEGIENVGKDLRDLRELTSMKEKPPFMEVIKTEVVPYLIKCLAVHFTQFVDEQTEAAWILTNLAFGETIHVQYLVHGGMFRAFLELLAVAQDRILIETVP
jgi:hypothetical protein